MPRSSPARRSTDQVLQLTARAGGVVAAVGLAGWILDVPSLRGFGSGTQVMVPWTAIGLLAVAAATLLFERGDGDTRTRAGLGFAAVGALVGLGALLGNLGGFDLGIETLWFPELLSQRPVENPGLPSLQTAATLVLLGASLLLGRHRPTRLAAALLAATAAGIGTAALLGRFADLPVLFDSAVFGSGGASLPTGIAVVLTGTAAALLPVRDDLVELARSTGARRVLAVALPAIYAVPALWVTTRAFAVSSRESTRVVIALLVGASGALLTGLGWRLAGVIRSLEEQLRGANRRLAQRLEAQTRQTELFGAAVESASDAILTKTLDGVITGWNQAASQLYGYEPDEIVGQHVEVLVPPDRRDELDRILAAVRHGQATRALRTVRVDEQGQRHQVLLTVSPVRDREGRVIGASAVARDITQEELLADRMRQAEKLDALGRLASGVAHDFNNSLAIILGAAELAQEQADGETADLLERIVNAARQSARTVKQLLTIGRRSAQHRDVIDLNQLVEDMVGLLDDLLGPRVELQLDLAPDLPAIAADATQVEQVVMNLVLNARDAMPDGGTISVRTSTASGVPLPDDPDTPTLPPGHVVLTIEDDGEGMTEEVQRRALEPFFTTKGADSGTGLGLATVHGIVTQGGGHVSLDSTPGQGTTIRIHLPTERPDRSAADTTDAAT